MSRKLQKGENISLNQVVEELNELVVGVACKKRPNDQTDYAIDISAFLLTEHEKVQSDSDFIFYNQPQSVDKAVVLKNNLFKIILNDLSIHIHKLAFVLSLHEAESHKQNFAQLDQILLKLFTLPDQQEILSYSLEHTNNETAIILGQLYRYKGEWKFKAIGQGFIKGLGYLAHHYGVQIASQEPSTDIVSEQTQSTTINAVAVSESNEKLNIHNTDIFSQQEQYLPIVNWLEMRNVNAKVNPDAMNTTGFFDEAAVTLGNNYPLLSVISDTIKRRYRLEKNKAYIELSKYSQEDIQKIRNFCQELYDYALVAKYFYNKQELKISLHLQLAPKIVNFFNGEWLEWFAFMKVIALCQENNWNYACTRNMIINFENNEKYEVDVFFLVNDKPLFIECKSGEYREYLDRYLRLRKMLFINKSRFLFLITEKNISKVSALSSMFDITFVNQENIDTYLKQIL